MTLDLTIIDPSLGVIVVTDDIEDDGNGGDFWMNFGGETIWSRRSSLSGDLLKTWSAFTIEYEEKEQVRTTIRNGFKSIFDIRLSLVDLIVED